MEIDQRRLARARQAFAENDVIDASVRPSVMQAWRRSKAAGVPAKGALGVRPHDDFDQESPLLRAVQPVTARLMEQFGTTDVAMMVIDRDARIVGRWINGPLLGRELDRAGSLLGKVMDESVVGSTGLGSVLEVRNSVVIAGAEHWNESFDSLTAVGAPIIHPATGVVEGAIDVVCLTGAPVGLMLPLVKAAALQAADRLLSGYAREDRELLDAFLQSDRRGPRRPIAAVNARITLTNRRADAMLRDRPGALTWSEIERALVEGRSEIKVGDPSAPITARVREIHSASGSRGAVIQLVENSPEPHRGQNLRPPQTTSSTARPAPRAWQVNRDRTAILESVRERAVGRTLSWEAVVHAAVNALHPGGRLLLTGPVGSGKSHLAAVLGEALGTVVHFDIGTAVRTGSIDADVAVVDDGNALRDRAAQVALDRWLLSLEAAASSTIVIATLTADVDAPGELMSAFDDIVALPALASRVPDIDELVDAWVATHPPLRVDAAARRRLTERSWPGNVRQLYRVLSVAAGRSDGHVIRLGDLPAGPNTPSPPRSLTYLENVERSAIAALFEATGGNKMRVAAELGISRATLYRKMAALGLGD